MWNKLKNLQPRTAGTLLVGAIMLTNVLNFAFNLFLSRNLNFEQYGIVTLVNTLWMLAGVVIISLTQTVNHHTAYLATKASSATAAHFVAVTRRKVALASCGLSLLWLGLTPWLTGYFNLPNPLALIAFTPVILFGCLAAVEKGFLQGSMAFIWLGVVIVIEALSKLLFAVGLTQTGWADLAYTSIVASVVLSFLIAVAVSSRTKAMPPAGPLSAAFPHKFMLAAAVATVSSTAFITIDVLLAKHYLDPVTAGKYAVLSLVGKMIFFFGSIFNSFIVTLVARAHGQGQSTTKIFNQLFLVTLVTSLAGAIGLAVLGHILVPLMFGARSATIVPFLPAYAFALAAFTASVAIVTYHLAKQRYAFPVVALIFTVALALGIITHHATITDFVDVIVVVSIAQLIALIPMHLVVERAKPVADPSRRLRILHLGFEDFRRPGSGGGAVRTHEINRRIAAHHDITVLASQYPGSRDRTEDGVRYVHIGRPWGYFGSIITYFLALPWVSRKYPADLVVEDFAAPISSSLSPLWDRRRSIAMVQWLNASEKSRQYRLPFWLFEKLGLRLHRNYITVSQGIADRLHAANRRANVTVIGNGVPKLAFDEPLHTSRHDIVYLGRLEKAQKGLDLLLDAFAGIKDQTKARLVLLGDGPDEAWMRERAAELGISDRIDFRGRIESTAKFHALATAQVMAMPSRFETFGMTAVEALSVGTPVVAFDIDCLREVVPTDLSVLVPCFDTDAYGRALLKYIGASTRTTAASRRLEEQRRDFARTYDWDVLAAQQQQVYEQRAGFKPVTATGDSATDTLSSMFNQLARQHTNRPNRAKAVIIGNYGNGNTGDEAILARISQLAKPYVDLCVLARDGGATRRLHQVDAVTRLSWRGLHALLSSDIIAIGGGGMFGAGLPFLVRLLPIAGLIMTFFSKKVVFVAIGAYPDTPKSTAIILRWLVRRAHTVTVREAMTAKFLATGSIKPIIVSDPAVSLEIATNAEIAAALGKTKHSPSRLVISLKPAPANAINEAQIRHAVAAINHWTKQTNQGVDLLCLSSKGDFGFGEKLSDQTLAIQAKSLCDQPELVTITGPGLPPQVAKGIIATAAGVIGARLHAQIFAHATNTPVLGLAFELKSRQFLDDIAAPYVTLPTDPTATTKSWVDKLARHQSRTTA